MSIADTQESYIDFDFRTSPTTIGVPELPPDKTAFHGGRIFPVDDVAEDTTHDNGERPAAAGREDDQTKMSTEAKVSSNSLLSNVLYGLKALRNLFACRSESSTGSVCSDFNAVESNCGQPRSTQEPKPRSSLYRKLLSPICDSWFERNPKDRKRKARRIFEINGRGPISEVLQTIGTGRLSTNKEYSSSQPSTAPSSPLNYTSGSPTYKYGTSTINIGREKRSSVESESAISSLVSFCNRSSAN